MDKVEGAETDEPVEGAVEMAADAGSPATTTEIEGAEAAEATLADEAEDEAEVSEPLPPRAKSAASLPTATASKATAAHADMTFLPTCAN